MGLHISVVMPVYNERYLVEQSIRRVLAVDDPIVSRLDLIVVDDGSTDGSRAVLRELAEKHRERIVYLEHARNRGKGAALRTGIRHAQGVVTVFQDADLEYNPADLPRLLRPFVEEAADAVYGSRFAPSDYRRVLFYRHTLGNRLLTGLSNLLTDLNLTDMETCYKAVRTDLLRSLGLRSNDFRIEPEVTVKLARRSARIFEVPIRYAGRTYEEGKKIGLKDAFLAVQAMLRHWLFDDHGDEGARMLYALAGAPGFNHWLGDAIRPYVGDSVLEVGAGIGNITRTQLPRLRYAATDADPRFVGSLTSLAHNRPFLEAARLDLECSDDFYPFLGSFDTVLCLNVLEHVEDDAGALRNLRSALRDGGQAVVLVPQDPRLFGSLDEAAGHLRRYTRATLRERLEGAGFEVQRMFDFNRATVPGWWLNGRLLRRRRLSKLQLSLVNRTAGLLRRLDPVLPWEGVSLIAVATPV